MRYALIALLFTAVLIGFFCLFDPSIGNLANHRAMTSRENGFVRAVKHVGEPVRKGESPL